MGITIGGVLREKITRIVLEKTKKGQNEKETEKRKIFFF